MLKFLGAVGGEWKLYLPKADYEDHEKSTLVTWTNPNGTLSNIRVDHLLDMMNTDLDNAARIVREHINMIFLYSYTATGLHLLTTPNNQLRIGDRELYLQNAIVDTGAVNTYHTLDSPSFAGLMELLLQRKINASVVKQGGIGAGWRPVLHVTSGSIDVDIRSAYCVGVGNMVTDLTVAVVGMTSEDVRRILGNTDLRGCLSDRDLLLLTTYMRWYDADVLENRYTAEDVNNYTLIGLDVLVAANRHTFTNSDGSRTVAASEAPFTAIQIKLLASLHNRIAYRMITPNS